MIRLITRRRPDNTDKPDNSQTPGGGHNAVQGDQFASGSYNYILIEPVLGLGVPRSSILSAVGKPSYFFSHSFANDSYIIDCYNLNDGSKLYLDYGYARDNLRSAAIYKNGSYTSVLNAQWTEQVNARRLYAAIRLTRISWAGLKRI